MKKVLSLIALFLVLLGVQWASASITMDVSPYKICFKESEIPDLKYIDNWRFGTVGPGWTHVTGIVETKDCHQQIQMLESGIRFGAAVADYHQAGYIFSPTVHGDVSLKVRSNSGEGRLVVYKMRHFKLQDAFIDKELVVNKDVNSEEYETVVLNEPQMSGYANDFRYMIIGDNVDVDEFEASKAEIPEQHFALELVDDEPTTAFLDNFRAYVNVKVVIKNFTDGDYYKSGIMSTYRNGSASVEDDSPFKLDFGDFYGSGPMVDGFTKDFIVWAKTKVTTEFTFQSPDDYFRSENLPITFSSTLLHKNLPIPGPSVTFDKKDSELAVYMDIYKKSPEIYLEEPLNSGYTYDFGLLTENTSIPIYFKNVGTNDDVTNIWVKPYEDFTSTIRELRLYPGYKEEYLLKANVKDSEDNPLDYGPHEKELNIVYNVGNDETTEHKFAIKLKSYVADPEKVIALFSGENVPEDIIEGDGKGNNVGKVYDDNLFRAYESVANQTWITTPLLNFNGDDDLMFEMKGKNENSYITISYSSDGKNWTEAETINKDNKMTVYGGKEGLEENVIKHIHVEGIPAGNYYVRFTLHDAFIRNVYGVKKADVAHDWILTSLSVPQNMEVNTPTTVTAELKNMTSNVEDGWSYDAELYVNNKLVAHSFNCTTTMEGYAKNAYNFNFTPHEAGTFEAYVKFFTNYHSYELKSEAFKMTIKEESILRTVQLADEGEELGRDRSGLNMQSKHSESENIYSEAFVESFVKKGEKIYKLIFTGKSENLTSAVKVWMQTGPNNVQSSYDVEEPINKEGMTLVFDNENYQWPVGDSINILEITLDKPVVYDGGDLRIVMESIGTEVSDNILFDVYGYNHGFTRYEVQLDGDKIGWSLFESLPVLTLQVDNNPFKVYGKVVDKETQAPLANATVNLQSIYPDDYKYTTTTDENGNYCIDVTRKLCNYDLKVSAPDHLSHYYYNALLSDSTIFRLIELEEAQTIVLDFGESEFQTLTLPFSSPLFDGLIVYDITEITADNIIHVSRVPQMIEENHPYLVRRQRGTNRTKFEFVGKGESIPDRWFTTQYMAGTTTNQKAQEGDYVLQSLDGSQVFRRVSAEDDITVPAYRAVLRNASMNDKSFKIVIATDGIEDVVNDADALVDVYSIQGVKIRSQVKASEALEGLKPGLYIVGGKKVLVK